MTDDSDSADREFWEWAKANDCSHEAMANARVATERLSRRRRLRAEYNHARIRAVFFDAMKDGGKKSTAVFVTAKRLGVSEGTVWDAIASPPDAPPLTKERFRETLLANLAFAQSCGNTRAAEVLRHQLQKLDRTTF
jgi:hypothetical protein